jgi:hypothetical protein
MILKRKQHDEFSFWSILNAWTVHCSHVLVELFIIRDKHEKKLNEIKLRYAWNVYTQF